MVACCGGEGENMGLAKMALFSAHGHTHTHAANTAAGRKTLELENARMCHVEQDRKVGELLQKETNRKTAPPPD